MDSADPVKSIISQIEEYESGPQKIADTIKGLSSRQLNYHINLREWNINQIVVHLADTEMNFCMRMRKVIVEEKPVLQSFEQEDWANGLFYDKQDYQLGFDLFRALRKSTGQLLRLLPIEYWQREGIRDEKVVTLHKILEVALHHIPVHLEQINTIKSNLHFPK